MNRKQNTSQTTDPAIAVDTVLGVVNFKEITNVEQVEIGDTLMVVKDSKIIDEGIVEFIDFTIPFGNVIIKINNKDYGLGCDFYLIQEGQRTAEQKLIKLQRFNQVFKRKQANDAGVF